MNVNREILQNVFHALCVVATISLQINCIYRYSLNEDISVVEYQTFHNRKESIYPSISLCVVNPFYDIELKKYGMDINGSSYMKFLRGQIRDEQMTKIELTKCGPPWG